MYTAYCDDKIIYSPLMVEQKIITSDAKITYELNKAGSFTFTIPVMHPEYDHFKKLRSIITVKDDDTEIWRGRVIDTTKDFYNNKKIVCEGELAFLNDALIEPYDYSKSGITVGSMLNKYISSYRANCPTERDIRLGIITAVNSSTVIYPKSESYANVLTNMLSVLVETCGGHLQIRRSDGVSYLDYLNTAINMADQQITFGVNLLDLEEYVNAADVYTYLIPLGKKDDDGNPLTIESVNNGSKYIKSVDGEKLYGKIERCITWDNITDASLLKSTAEEKLASAIQEVTSIEITAVDLKLLGANVDSIEVGKYVTVISTPHDIHDNFLCSKIELNLHQPANSVYTFGVTRSSLTETQAVYNTSIKDVHITTDWLQAAIDNATAMMTGSKGGYKVTEYDEHGRWLRDLYMNAPNKEDASLVMQINMNGIGFSRDGFDGPYKNAWTIDGTFLGEFIKAGSVQTEALSAEYKSLVTDEINTISTAKFQVADQKITAEVTRASKAEDLLAASINVQAGKIEQRVSKGEFGSYVQQYYDRVLIGFNNDSKYVQITAGNISIYDNGVSDNKKRSEFNHNGNHFYRNNKYLGRIGTNSMAVTGGPSGYTFYGLEFDLEYDGGYMGWFAEISPNGGYKTALAYTRNPEIYGSEGLHVGADMYFHKFWLHDATLTGVKVGNGNVSYSTWTGSFNDGSGRTVSVINGMVVSVF